MKMVMEFYTGSYHVRLIPSFGAEGLTIGTGRTQQLAIAAAELQLNTIFGELRAKQHELLMVDWTKGRQYASA